MKKYIILIISFLFLQIEFLGALNLSSEAEVSLLTSAPYEGEVFTLYGHAAIRVKDKANRIDWVFNYGIFSFDKPNFIYRFAKGETDYMLGIMKYDGYIAEYQMRGSTVTEQVLNLTQLEKEKIVNALLVNYQPENREYRYNFFFDNCATRPAVLIEKNVEGEINYQWKPETLTFRDVINHCTRNHSWLTFGCDLALGSPTDRVMTLHEMFFLPEYLKEAVAKAHIIGEDGTSRPLVRHTEVIESEPDEAETEWITPMFCAILLLLITSGLTYYEWRYHKSCLGLDIVLFLVAGLSGCILFFLSFISEHPCTCPNYTMVWLHPFQLLVVFFNLVKKLRKCVIYYHFINFAAITLMLLVWFYLPQHFNTAFIPLILTLWMRSGFAISKGYLFRKETK